MSITLLQGDCLQMLPTLEAGSVDCIVTSPPYWGQRCYGTPGEIGGEATPEEFVDRLAAVFRECSRVLADAGSLWVNIGDTYISGRGAACGVDRKNPARRFGVRPQDKQVPGYRPKDLVGIPWMLAFALRRDGWIIRAENIWRKPNAMPEPTAVDRPARQHEHVFLFAKASRYHYAGATLGSVWDIPTTPDPEKHAAKMPMALAMRCVEYGCPPGGVVLDPFGGSGTTAAACLKAGRKAILVELNPEYIPVINRRLEAAATPLFAEAR